MSLLESKETTSSADSSSGEGLIREIVSEVLGSYDSDQAAALRNWWRSNHLGFKTSVLSRIKQLASPGTTAFKDEPIEIVQENVDEDQQSRSFETANGSFSK